MAGRSVQADLGLCSLADRCLVQRAWRFVAGGAFGHPTFGRRRCTRPRHSKAGVLRCAANVDASGVRREACADHAVRGGAGGRQHRCGSRQVRPAACGGARGANLFAHGAWEKKGIWQMKSQITELRRSFTLFGPLRSISHTLFGPLRSISHITFIHKWRMAIV